ncbi:VOC family protein [Jatrophihabitans telluris]|uniref:VOC family protein n=1 Tax=Jatrophihabitans telluris TaxID=2038343 RepID=A0ABY4QZ43_9ACTN|nr:VOC family protein [Jatrophihabitans telluris]UQX88679.1 VOC family protein [Jatrophihabitans telluris]
MSVDLFAGIAVSDYPRAMAWYELLFGAAPSFFPNDREAVWEIAEHRYVYIETRPGDAGHAMHTLFVTDLTGWTTAISGRGLEAADQQDYSNGVRKVTYRDPDGNEFGFGGNVGRTSAPAGATETS